MLWFKKRVCKADKTAHEEQVSVEINKIKVTTRKKVERTAEDIDRLNRLLKANGITLKIDIAAGGHHGR